MPPKAKAANQKGGSKSQGDDSKLKAAQGEINTLHSILIQKNVDEQRYKQQDLDWRHKYQQQSLALEKQRQDAQDVTSALIRQSKVTQESIGGKLKVLEQENSELKELLDEKNALIQQKDQQMETMRHEFDQEVSDYKRRLDDFQNQFDTMIHETLDKMYAKLDSMAETCII